jgi:tetratricopeptide (TPR) repeat protein
MVDEDAEAALAHAVAARRLASRIAVVREAVGITAYHAGEWQTAVAELRTYHRMTGRQTHLAVLADCERALGRPEKAIDIYRSADPAQLERADAVELLIVAAGARRDMGQDEAAVAMLQVRELAVEGPWSARLRYAYADGLLAVGRREEAREWLARALEADDEGQTDAAERLLELDGVTLDDADVDAGAEDIDGEVDGVPGADGDGDGAADLDEEDEFDDDEDDEHDVYDDDEDDGEDFEDDEDHEAYDEADEDDAEDEEDEEDDEDDEDDAYDDGDDEDGDGEDGDGDGGDRESGDVGGVGEGLSGRGAVDVTGEAAVGQEAGGAGSPGADAGGEADPEAKP